MNAGVDLAEYIDWINDFSVDSITRSEPESGARTLPAQGVALCRQTDASLSRPSSTWIDPQKAT